MLARRKNDLDDLQKRRNEVSDGLLKLRDAEILDCKKQIEALNEELEDVTSEHRALVALKMDELLNHWADKEKDARAYALLEVEVKRLKRQLDIHISQAPDDV